MIAIVDYGRGNLFSLSQALRHLEIPHEVTDDPARIDAAERILFPGVGAFGDAMEGLKARGLVEPLKRAAADGRPLFGICVGCQLLLSQGEEFGAHEGLGLIPGTVSRVPDPCADDPYGIRVPNVGWRRLDDIADHPVLSALGPKDYVYFVHSFAPHPDLPDHVGATCRLNGEAVPVAVAAGSIAGVQFHPEKSGETGLRLLQRFASATYR